jgi:hypothetical protein
VLVDVVANLTYNYRDDWLSKVHTGVPNVETSSVCILHCQMCFRSKIYEPKGSDSKNEFVESLRETDVLSLENFEKMLQFFPRISLCGNYSDPVYWKNLIPAFALLKTYPDNRLKINTAAHAPDIEWYREAFKRSSRQVQWQFGLDGLAHNADVYRNGQNSQLILDAMLLGASMGKRIIWQYIVMEYNKDDVSEARRLAKENQIQFLRVYSDRITSPKNNQQLRLINVNEKDKVTTLY